MWDKLQILLKDVDKCFTAANAIKVSGIKYRKPEPSDKHLADEQQLEEAFKWLQTFVSDDIETFMVTYERHTPDVWDNYLALDYAKSLSEYRDLQGFARAIKARWQTRPAILKARKHVKKELQEQEAADGDGSQCEENLHALHGDQASAREA